MLFKDLGLIEPLLTALQVEGYTSATPIQQQAIPLLLDQNDLLACAQTGTGKTAAFALPLLQLMFTTKNTSLKPAGIQTLVLTPTRELAIQIDESFKAYGKFTGFRSLVIFGGVNQRSQTDTLKKGVEILIATPGRLLDLMNQGYIKLNDLRFLVLDEADRMLDMGFVHDVKRIIAKLPVKRQTLLFSATMPEEIRSLSKSLLSNPQKIEVTPVSSTAETIEQAVYYVNHRDKKPLLLHLLQDKAIPSALVFTRTKHGADKVAKDLVRSGIHAEAIHGNKSQVARQRALNNFKSRNTRVLVATDIAARGIDVEELSHVINFDIPNIAETYVHRIGRTGRAGASGIAISFCDHDERPFLRDIHKLISKNIPVVTHHPFDSASVSRPEPSVKSQRTAVRTYGHPEPKNRIQRPLVYRSN